MYIYRECNNQMRQLGFPMAKVSHNLMYSVGWKDFLGFGWPSDITCAFPSGLWMKLERIWCWSSNVFWVRSGCNKRRGSNCIEKHVFITKDKDPENICKKRQKLEKMKWYTKLCLWRNDRRFKFAAFNDRLN